MPKTEIIQIGIPQTFISFAFVIHNQCKILAILVQNVATGHAEVSEGFEKIVNPGNMACQ